MKVEKLFRVLVVGGAVLVGQSASLASMQELASESPPDPIFCTDEEACPKDEHGVRKVKEGFACCWGTSCDDVE